MPVQLLSISEIAKDITPVTSLLATRAFGKRFWEQLKMRLRQTPDRVVSLSFTGVEIMDASFSDEVFGTLAALRTRRTENLSPVVLADINATCLENISMALETRIDREASEQGRLRNCVLPVAQAEKLVLIGKYEYHVKQSFDLLNQKSSLTARDAAEAFDLNLNAASTRLKTLADLGLALRIEIRDSQGKQYIYHQLK